MHSPELVIFDCDGVLIDSEIVSARIDSELLTEAGFPISPEEMAERYAGLTFRDILLAVEKEASIPFQATLLDEERRRTEKRVKEIKMIDGARQAVAAVSQPHCICSNSRLERLELILGRLGLLPLFAGRIFSAVSIEGLRPKPSPDIFLHAARQMQADPARTFVIEDSVHGIHGARSAGMRVIGFTGGSHTWLGHADALTEAGAETVINRLPDLGPVIAALSQWSDD